MEKKTFEIQVIESHRSHWEAEAYDEQDAIVQWEEGNAKFVRRVLSRIDEVVAAEEKYPSSPRPPMGSGRAA